MIALSSLSAQSFIGKINPFPQEKIYSSSNDTIKILAVLVEFEEDRDAATVGNGKFNSIYRRDYGNTIIDPLPHDKTYFENHLEFVKNYYNKVSKGKVNIEFVVMPEIFTVTQTMRNYSPEPRSNDFKPLADFTKEVWEIVNLQKPDFNYQDFNLFTIFHAGVGRDISLPGSLGIERDLPSIYLGENGYKEIYGNNFDGFSVGGSGFKINNSMIIPQTQNREVETFTGTFLLEITINGLLAASVASHLGLPDLFDTKTGLSAIGRFGLMDGQAIFGYGGAFPPEPSAWEKIYLGWETPVEVTLGNHSLSVVANIAAQLNDTVIVKIPINEKEYFLIENRQRDVYNNGSTVTYKLGNSISTQTFFSDTNGYRSFNIEALRGVIVDVDEYDWAVPGNGILIWHIDEKIINTKLASNEINTDKRNRGVDLEEADGIQDIGEQFTTIFGDVVIGEGEAVDMWFASNESKMYKNRFDKNTFPNSRTNEGANSLISIFDFSESANRMTFKVEFGDSIIKPIGTAKLPGEVTASTYFNTNSGIKFFHLINNNLYQTDEFGNLIQFPLNTQFINNFSKKGLAYKEINGLNYLAGVFDDKLRILVNDGNIIFSEHTFQINDTLTTEPVFIKKLNEQFYIAAGTNKGSVEIFNLGDLLLPPTLNESINLNTTQKVNQIITNNSFWAATSGNKIVDSEGNTVTTENEISQIVLSKSKNDERLIVAELFNNKFVVYKNGNLFSSFNKIGSNNSSFIITDLKQNGENYIVYSSGVYVEAVNLSGNSAENFPFKDLQGQLFINNIVSADFEGDSKAEIIFTTTDGRLFAVDGSTGKVVNGFPLSLAANNENNFPLFFIKDNKLSLAVNDKDFNFYTWSISSIEGKVFWNGKNGTLDNSGFVSAASSNLFVNEFFPKNKSYNYPNPVYGTETSIRYYVSESSNVNIKIFDLAGGLVAELNDYANGGFDNETVWNVSDVQSGVYLARIEASSGGKTESNIIKIAVIK